MHTNVRPGQRGQAIAETVVFLPIFLFVLFGTIWAVKSAVQYERVESAVRYAGLIQQQENPYIDYSLYAVYQQLGPVPMPTVACIKPLTTPLSDGAPTYSSASTTTASGAFWQPFSALPGCTANGVIGAAGGSAGFYQDVLLSGQRPNISSTVLVPSSLQAKLGSSTTFAADAFFIKPVSVGIILACYPTLNATITLNLKYLTDVSVAVTPTAMPNSVPAASLQAASSCTTY